MRFGIYDTVSTNDWQQATRGILDAFCSSSSSEASASRDVGVNLGISIKGVPVKLGYNDDSNSFNKWATSTCRTYRANENVVRRVATAIQSINPQLLDVVKSCMLRKGLHAIISQPSPTSRHFVLLFDFSPDSERVRDAKIRAVSFSRNLKCPDLPARFTVATARPFLCERLDDNEAVITLTTDPVPVEGGVLNLRSIQKPLEVREVVQRVSLCSGNHNNCTGMTNARPTPYGNCDLTVPLGTIPQGFAAVPGDPVEWSVVEDLDGRFDFTVTKAAVHDDPTLLVLCGHRPDNANRLSVIEVKTMVYKQ